MQVNLRNPVVLAKIRRKVGKATDLAMDLACAACSMGRTLGTVQMQDPATGVLWSHTVYNRDLSEVAMWSTGPTVSAGRAHRPIAVSDASTAKLWARLAPEEHAGFDPENPAWTQAVDRTQAVRRLHALGVTALREVA